MQLTFGFKTAEIELLKQKKMARSDLIIVSLIFYLLGIKSIASSSGL